MTATIDKDHPEYDSLYSIWIQERKPGWITHGNRQYKVIQPSQDDVKFVLQPGGMDGEYSSLSSKGIAP